MKVILSAIAILGWTTLPPVTATAQVQLGNLNLQHVSVVPRDFSFRRSGSIQKRRSSQDFAGFLVSDIRDTDNIGRLESIFVNGLLPNDRRLCGKAISADETVELSFQVVIEAPSTGSSVRVNFPRSADFNGLLRSDVAFAVFSEDLNSSDRCRESDQSEYLRISLNAPSAQREIVLGINSQMSASLPFGASLNGRQVRGACRAAPSSGIRSQFRGLIRALCTIGVPENSIQRVNVVSIGRSSTDPTYTPFRVRFR
jgi:hypothetical protein